MMNEIAYKVENKQQLFDVLEANLDVIKSYGVSQFGVFGSFVRNEMNEASDVDFLVDFFPQRKTLTNIIKLADYLEDVTGRKVELVTVKALSKYIGPQILATTEYVIF